MPSSGSSMSTQARLGVFTQCFVSNPVSGILLQAFTPQISLVATAPLTNLALAVKMDPSIPSKLHGLYIMGGNTECQ